MHTAIFSGSAVCAAGIQRLLLGHCFNFTLNRFEIVNAVTRTAFDAKDTFDAFLPVNDWQAAIAIFYHGDGFSRTVFGTETAADTGNAAIGHGCFTFSTVIAFNVDFSIRIAQIKNFLRALSNADTAAGTFSIIKNGQTVAAHRNCLEWAALDAGAETKTTEVAFAWTTLSFSR